MVQNGENFSNGKMFYDCEKNLNNITARRFHRYLINLIGLTLEFKRRYSI